MSLIQIPQKVVSSNILPHLSKDDLFAFALTSKTTLKVSGLPQLIQFFKDVQNNQTSKVPFSDIKHLFSGQLLYTIPREKISNLVKNLFPEDEKSRQDTLFETKDLEYLATMLVPHAYCSIDSMLVEKSAFEARKNDIDAIISKYKNSKHQEKDLQKINEHLKVLNRSLPLFKDLSSAEGGKNYAYFSHRLRAFLDDLSQNDIKNLPAIQTAKEYTKDNIENWKEHPLLKKDKQIVLDAIRKIWEDPHFLKNHK